MRWSILYRPCLVSTSLANLHRQRSYGGRGAARAGVRTTPLPRKASILPCAAKAAHYTPCCPTFAFPSPRRMTQFSRGLRRSRTDIGAEDGTTTPEGATRTVQRDLGILLASATVLEGEGLVIPVLEATSRRGVSQHPHRTCISRSQSTRSWTKPNLEGALLGY